MAAADPVGGTGGTATAGTVLAGIDALVDWEAIVAVFDADTVGGGAIGWLGDGGTGPAIVGGGPIGWLGGGGGATTGGGAIG